MPGLLVKVAPTFKLALTNWKSTEPLIINSNIAHVGGSLIDITSTSFTQLQTWMDNGGAENKAHQADRHYDKSAFSDVLGGDPTVGPGTHPPAAGFSTFKDRGQPGVGGKWAGPQRP